MNADFTIILFKFYHKINDDSFEMSKSAMIDINMPREATESTLFNSRRKNKWMA